MPSKVSELSQLRKCQKKSENQNIRKSEIVRINQNSEIVRNSRKIEEKDRNSKKIRNHHKILGTVLKSQKICQR